MSAASLYLHCCCSVLFILVNILMIDDKVDQKSCRGYTSRSTERGLCQTNMHTHTFNMATPYKVT